jgi:hypothetical protein
LWKGPERKQEKSRKGQRGTGKRRKNGIETDEWIGTSLRERERERESEGEGGRTKHRPEARRGEERREGGISGPR